MRDRTQRIKSLAAKARFRIGPVVVHPDVLVVVLDGREVSLEPRVMEVLVALAEHAGEVVSAEQLLIEVWGGSFYGDNPVHKAIAHLRRVVGDDSRAPHFIETIRKRGYRLIAEVSFPNEYRRAAVQTVAWEDRCPYVGLSAFDKDHTSVFFGRSRMTAELLTTMRKQVENQCRFVLMVGASGCGKTSLLHAGAIPLLRQERGFGGLRSLSVANCDLSGAVGGQSITQLAIALAQWTLGDRSVFAAESPAVLAQLLIERPASVEEAIAVAFQRHPIRARPDDPIPHLLLVIDHAEALVAVPSIGADERAKFAQVVNLLCASPHALVVMIVRSDFYPKLSEVIPNLIQLKGGDGHLDVFTPRAGEIAQIIRTPAVLAGLSFEQDPISAARLDDVLRDAANEQPDALPLLQHTLQALYERRNDAGVMSFQAYRDIGGLEGALTHRAETVFAALSSNAQASLSRVLSLLTVIQRDTDAVSSQRALRSSIMDPGGQVLIEAFIRARLFVGELNDGCPSFGVAHESLLRQWPRASEWAHQNRHILQARARLQRSTLRWIEDRRGNDHLLNSGRPLSEAQEVAKDLCDDLSADERAYLNASVRSNKRKRWLRIGATAALGVLALVSSVLSVLATRSRDDAEQRRAEALRLADFMLVDLAEELRPLGNLKLLNSIGTEALAYLERRPAESMQVEDLVNHSRALRTVGEVLMEQAKLDQAKLAFSRAKQVAHQAAVMAPESATALAESGVAAYWMGYYDYRQNRLDDARQHMADYLDSAEKLVRIDPENKVWQIELSYAANNLGSIARDQGRTNEAIAYFNRSARLKKNVLLHTPDDQALQFELIDTLSWISSGDESQGRLAEAAQGYDEQIKMLRLLIDGNVEARAWERRLATSLRRRAKLAVARGRVDLAAAQIEESISRLADLTHQESGNRVWVRDLALAHVQSSAIARMRGNITAERAHLRHAELMVKRIHAESELLPSWQRLYATIRLRAIALDPISDASLIRSNRAIAELMSVVANAGGDVKEIAVVANVLVLSGIHLAAEGLSDNAQQCWQMAVKMLEGYVVDTKDPIALAPWVSASILLGTRDRVEAQINWLASIGYRHPDYITVVSKNPIPAPQ